jgi:ClpP class serine protease
MFSHTLSAALRGRWLLDKAWAESHLPLVESMLSGQPVDFSSKSSQHFINDEGQFMAQAIVGAGGGVIQKGRWNSFDEAPEGSIALIPITGPITKYNGECGEPGSAQYSSWVQQAEASPNISGIIFKVDSPGGMVDGTATFADTIRAAKKPTLSFVDDGMMASAGTWIGTSANEVWASQKTDTIGSIGVYTTMMDFKGFFEQRGIKVRDIYAPQSSEKNLDYRNALEGDDALILDDLSFIAKEFIRTIKANRKGKLNLEFADPFKGKMFRAEDAISVGLIDGISTFEQAISRVAEMANERSQNSTSKKLYHMFGKNAFKAVSALAGVTAEDITEEQFTAANANLVSEKITAVVFAPADYAATLKTAQDALATATSEKKTSDDALTKLQGDFDAFKAGKGAGAAGSQKDGDDEIPGGEKEEDKFLTSADKKAREMVAGQK